MGLFDKKFCDVCGQKIGLLGNRKLEDGNLCKDCAALLSPWMTDRRHQTVAEIKEHLAYREENKKKVEEFQVTSVIGDTMKVYLDETNGRFFVTTAVKYKDVNPDVLDFTQVTGCDMNIDEDKDEIMDRNEEGRSVSFNPPRYEYYYNFNITIHVNSPWFDEISFRVNNSRVEGRGSVEYHEAERETIEIREALTKVRADVREAAVRANAPKQSVTCPFCGASTIPDANGRCEYCGGAVNG